jgi:hypothetical protein
MAKEAIKERIRKTRGSKCGITGKKLPKENALIDTDRIQPKAGGGTYTEENTRIADPVEHMKRHGNLRLRPEELDELKEVLDDREQVRKAAQKVSNQLLAYGRRTDRLHPRTAEWLAGQSESMERDLIERTHRLEKWILAHRKEDKLIEAALGVKGVGPVTVAYCLVYLDLEGRFPETEIDPKTGKEQPHPRAGQEKCPHASSVWKYTGLDVASHDRYQKGKKGGGCKPLRTVLWTMSDSQIKGSGAYAELYYALHRPQARIDKGEPPGRLDVSDKITQSRDTAGTLKATAWKDTKAGHRHGAGLRAIMKAFLADWWYVGRDILGLNTDADPRCYAEAQLGGSHRTVNPRERGWTW